MQRNKLKIAIQKSGRLHEDSVRLLKDCGIDLKNGVNKLRTEADNFPMEIYFLRDDDIPQYVEDQVADIGIVGENVLHEKRRNVESIDPSGIEDVGKRASRSAYSTGHAETPASAPEQEGETMKNFRKIGILAVLALGVSVARYYRGRFHRLVQGHCCRPDRRQRPAFLARCKTRHWCPDERCRYRDECECS